MNRIVALALGLAVIASLPASALMMEPEIDFTSPYVPVALGVALFGWLLGQGKRRP